MKGCLEGHKWTWEWVWSSRAVRYREEFPFRQADVSFQRVSKKHGSACVALQVLLLVNRRFRQRQPPREATSLPCTKKNVTCRNMQESAMTETLRFIRAIRFNFRHTAIYFSCCRRATAAPSSFFFLFVSPFELSLSLTTLRLSWVHVWSVGLFLRIWRSSKNKQVGYASNIWLATQVTKKNYKQINNLMLRAISFCCMMEHCAAKQYLRHGREELGH